MRLVSFALDKDSRPRFGCLLGEGRILDFVDALQAEGVNAPPDHLAFFDLQGSLLPRCRAGVAAWASDGRFLRASSAVALEG